MEKRRGYQLHMGLAAALLLAGCGEPERAAQAAKENVATPPMRAVDEIVCTPPALAVPETNDAPDEAEMKRYTVPVPAAGKRRFLTMVPIPSGKFVMGSPQDEVGRNEDESPQREVTLDAFWMSESEVTWALYQKFMDNGKARHKDGSLKRKPSADSKPEELVSQPTPPYSPMHFSMGTGGYSGTYPAIGMTQHAASKFCEWLSAQTGEFYRLPTEAEWEYACRAGSTSAWSFGDDPELLDEYAWHAGNSDYEYQPVKQKKPNAWGLYDMHGNVAEWCLDAYTADGYPAEAATNPWNVATQRYPRVVRGGHWDSEPEETRSAARLASDPVWKVQDPQIPKSIWYHTDAPWLGFRVVRPLNPPKTQAEREKYWNTGPGEW
ncbi:formylglycine-generating enzyme family protein [Sulfuriroseicoccus oceanibius]|uniref:Formylglycine-generating enzyme family protein n=1 Tax=Sulfuriroseicoccus oceanibius TaxID=2707525 RepID=A0A7T7F2F0_9BACT|nr:formylglycine-generating enzyme family protein [Sulfuriroseicoccus oceanibius]QQL45394.1 formylglycine-generating enzyme family protein [Sulfuriroseicoccus oceanibius]